MPIRTNAQGKTANEQLNLIESAMSGELTMVISPETVAPEPTAAAWTRDVTISIVNDAGEVQQWLNQAYAATASIADDSTDGEATIASTILTLVNGVATITVSGDAEAWLDSETDTLTIANITIMGYTVTGGTSVETFTT